MHVPVQRPPEGPSIRSTSASYLAAVSHPADVGDHPNHPNTFHTAADQQQQQQQQQAWSPQHPPNTASTQQQTAMIPGGFSAPFSFSNEAQAPRTHGLDYSQWVAAYQHQSGQPIYPNGPSQSHPSYLQQHHPHAQAPLHQQHPHQQQAPMFPGAFQPPPTSAVPDNRQPRDSLGELPPRIGLGVYPSREGIQHGGGGMQQQNGYQSQQRIPQHQYYGQPTSPSILTTQEQQRAQVYMMQENEQYANSTYPSQTQTSPPSHVSPEPSTSPSDPATYSVPAPTPARATRTKRPPKRQRPAEPLDVGSGDESDGFGSRLPGGDIYGGPRLPGACTHCKKLKMKCDFPPDATVCKRCKNSGHQCVVEGRKPRSAPNKREYLMAQLRQKDAVIESLLKQLHNPFVSKTISIANYQQSVPLEQQSPDVVSWLDRLKNRPSGSSRPAMNHYRSSLSPSDALRDPNAVTSDVESIGASGENGDEPDDDSEEGTAESLVDSERLIPDQAFPVGLFATLSLSATRKSTREKAAQAVLANPDAQNEDDVGVANETYFMPGPATDLRIRQRLLEQTSPPEILVHGLVTPDDVDRLFGIFFDRINIFFPLLDPILHTPASAFSRCPFLFTAICAISCRYDPEKAEIYPLAMHFAKSEASAALIKGWKSVELCQAYILMAVYGPPARRWEEDRGWIFTGLAIRVAMDLNLHIPSNSKPQTEKQAREALNKTRTWMICYNMDRSTGTQFGKPCTIKDEYIECHPPDFYKSSPYNSPYDVHICAYNALLRIVGKMHTQLFSGGIEALGMNKRLDLPVVISQFEAELTHCHEEWYRRIEERRIPHDLIYEMRSALLPFVVGYSKLVLHSFAFQQAFVRGVQPTDKPMFNKCLEAAKSTVTTFIERLATSGNMRYSPDGWFLIASFASAFLFKLLRPQFKSLVSQEQETELLSLVGRLIQTLSSPDIAIDDRHTPKVYARFLASLLSRHRREGVASFGLHINPPPAQPLGPASSTSGYGSRTQHQSQAPSSAGYTPSSQSFGPQNGAGNGNGYAMHQDRSMSISQSQSQAQAQSQCHQSQQMLQEPVVNVEGPMEDAAYQVDSMPSQMSFTAAAEDGGHASDGWSDDGHLASMQVLQNPAWWDQMMLPGFSWPQQQPVSPQSSTSSVFSANAQQQYSMQHPIQT